MLNNNLKIAVYGRRSIHHQVALVCIVVFKVATGMGIGGRYDIGSNVGGGMGYEINKFE